MRRTFTGPANGLGAQYAWQGNDKVGAGRMEITEAAQPERTVIKLDFLKPFESHNTTTFTMTPEGDGTKVNWTMTGPSPYVSKVMTVFVSMDRMIGKDFEKGLNNLKAAAER
ncbi:Polyketide cyclase / dehydrase and lipid transport [Janthinobacterium lividum]|nr:Polyketide cyclase / dehydrase and lipid transport [Janthinobacterium lividum]